MLPVVDYHALQLRSLQATINSIEADVVVCATPCGRKALINVEKPVVEARYWYSEVGGLDSNKRLLMYQTSNGRKNDLPNATASVRLNNEMFSVSPSCQASVVCRSLRNTISVHML